MHIYLTRDADAAGTLAYWHSETPPVFNAQEGLWEHASPLVFWEGAQLSEIMPPWNIELPKHGECIELMLTIA